jgi:integrase
MAHVQKRTRSDGKPVYVVKYRTPDGKGRSKGGFLTKKSAEAYATTVDYRTDRGGTFDPRAGHVVFRDAATAWLKTRLDLKPRTREGHTRLLSPRQHRTATTTLSIDATFGGYPLNRITRQQVADWVAAQSRAGLKPSTVRNAFFVLHQVLAQAVVDGQLVVNPSDNARLPTEHSTGGKAVGVVDDPAQFLTAGQVAALVEATPWPYDVLVQLAAWCGLRAAELDGLQVGDVTLPQAPSKPGMLRVERTVLYLGGELVHDSPKTRGSRRRVPLPADTAAVLGEYIAAHPRAHEPDAPLFPGFRMTPARRTGYRTTTDAVAARAALSVTDAGARLTLDWESPLHHGSFYRNVYRPAVLRACRLTLGVGLPPDLRFHALRHTYASLCVSAGIPALSIAKFMGHSKVTTTLTIYAHLFDDDHSAAMTALGALTAPRPAAANVVPIRGVS